MFLFVFDGHNESEINNREHDQSQKSSIGPPISNTLQNVIPTPKDNFLSNETNKMTFISILAIHMKEKKLQALVHKRKPASVFN